MKSSSRLERFSPIKCAESICQISSERRVEWQKVWQEKELCITGEMLKNHEAMLAYKTSWKETKNIIVYICSAALYSFLILIYLVFGQDDNYNNSVVWIASVGISYAQIVSFLAGFILIIINWFFCSSFEESSTIDYVQSLLLLAFSITFSFFMVGVDRNDSYIWNVVRKVAGILAIVLILQLIVVGYRKMKISRFMNKSIDLQYDQRVIYYVHSYLTGRESQGSKCSLGAHKKVSSSLGATKRWISVISHASSVLRRQ